MPVPDELVEAIDAALACEAEETDVHARARLLATTRSALEDWLRGEVAKSYDEFAADPSSRARFQPSSDFDPQATAAKVHECNFGAIDQKFCLALISV